jgi:transcriptional regulator of nitric oxide reductase
MSDRVEIAGGADADVAAAIAAVVSQILAEEAAVRATPTVRAEHSAWVEAGRLRQAPAMVRGTQDAPDWSQFVSDEGR